MKRLSKLILNMVLCLSLILSCGAVSENAYAAEGDVSPTVTQIRYPDDITKLYSVGSPDNGYSTINVSLSGTNLDRLSKSDFLFTVDGNEVQLDDSEEFIYDRQFHIASADNDSAVVWIAFPANDLEKSRECSITVLCAGDNVPDKVKTYTMDPKPESTENKFSLEVDDWKAILSGDGRISIMFNVEDRLDLNIDAEEAKDYIFFASNNSEKYEDVVWLADEDTVSMSGNVLTIDLAEKTGKVPGYYVILKSGLLRNSDGKTLGRDEFRRYHSAYITQGAHIQRMSYSQITLGSEGGDVAVKISGSGLDLADGLLRIKVFGDNTRGRTDAIEADEISINADGSEAEFTFHAPSNDTDRTQSYRLIPAINDTNAITTYIKGYDVISVLPEGASADDITLSSVEMQGAYDMDDALDVFSTSTSSEQFTSKVDAVIRGTNLSSRKTLVKAVDENGVTWPMLPVFECGATIRWQNSSSYLPEKESKNEQHIELLLPRRLGVPREFTLMFAPDGEHFLDAPVAKVIIDNQGLYDTDAIQAGMFTQSDFTELRDIEVKYVDSSGNELAESDHYKGYGITELYHQGIAPKEIEGYTLSGYSPYNLSSMLKQPIRHTSGEYIFDEGQWFVKDLKGQPIIYKYKKAGEEGGKEHDSLKPGAKVSLNGNDYSVITVPAAGTHGELAFTRAANKRSVSVPDTVKIAGNTFTVTAVAPYAFKGSKAKTVTIGKNVRSISRYAFKKSKVKTLIIKTTKLTKKSVKNSLKGSKVKTVKVKAGNKKLNKQYVKKYRKIFTKKNAGKKIKIK